MRNYAIKSCGENNKQKKKEGHEGNEGKKKEK